MRNFVFILLLLTGVIESDAVKLPQEEIKLKKKEIWDKGEKNKTFFPVSVSLEGRDLFFEFTELNESHYMKIQILDEEGYVVFSDETVIGSSMHYLINLNGFPTGYYTLICHDKGSEFSGTFYLE